MNTGCWFGNWLTNVDWGAIDWATWTVAFATLVLAIITLKYVRVVNNTLAAAEKTAEAASRQAEVMTHQFDVGSTPHLRPRVRVADLHNNSVIIELRNLSGAAAIHPGLYPKWLSRKHNVELVKLPDDDSLPDLPRGDYFTCPDIQVCEAWGCRVPLPSGESGKIEVRWGEMPWEEREHNIYIWSLERNPERPTDWHIVCWREDQHH